MTPEARVRNAVVAYACSKGCLHIRMHMGRGARTGWPDDLFIFKGRAMFLEFKAPGGTVKPMQKRVLVNLEAHGVVATVCSNVLYGSLLVDKFTK